MKRNIKGAFLIFLIYCLGIGCLYFFVKVLYPISYTNNHTQEDNEKNTSGTFKKADKTSESDITEAITSDSEDMVSLSPTPSPTPTPTPTPTPLPVYKLEKGGYPEIDKFFQDYYVAYNSCDYELLQSLVTEPDNIEPLSDLKKETRFLDDIRDITCYVMKSYEKGAYIVYVYHELKYVNITTTYPKLDKFYLVTDENGKLKIYTSEMDETLKAYYEARDKDEKVKSLIKTTNKKAAEALKSDANLKAYLEALDD